MTVKHKHGFGTQCALCCFNHPKDHRQLTAKEHHDRGQRRAARRRAKQ